ncbi:MAG TPA: hypothetical protein VM243_08900 [Phycisphaerae bacterium]|nr:hypothetical protein [Phycisphaerae bacterium]
MRVLPVGISASTLSVFWPLWDAALLRRYGRTEPLISDNLVAALVTAWLRRRGPVKRCPIHLPGDCRLPTLPAELFSPGETALSPLEEVPLLDLRWPSDDPLVPAQIVVIERWLREPPTMTGDLLDVLY